MERSHLRLRKDLFSHWGVPDCDIAFNSLPRGHTGHSCGSLVVAMAILQIRMVCFQAMGQMG